MMKTRISHAITSWLPLSAVAAGTAMMAGWLLNLPAAKTAMAAIASDITAFSALLMRSYTKKGEGEKECMGQPQAIK